MTLRIAAVGLSFLSGCQRSAPPASFQVESTVTAMPPSTASFLQDVEEALSDIGAASASLRDGVARVQMSRPKVTIGIHASLLVSICYAASRQPGLQLASLEVTNENGKQGYRVANPASACAEVLKARVTQIERAALAVSLPITASSTRP